MGCGLNDIYVCDVVIGVELLLMLYEGFGSYGGEFLCGGDVVYFFLNIDCDLIVFGRFLLE